LRLEAAKPVLGQSRRLRASCHLLRLLPSASHDE
jgi:hypothetical protein